MRYKAREQEGAKELSACICVCMPAMCIVSVCVCVCVCVNVCVFECVCICVFVRNFRVIQQNDQSSGRVKIRFSDLHATIMVI